MRRTVFVGGLVLLAAVHGATAQPATAPPVVTPPAAVQPAASPSATQPSLTIYNQNFGVVRETVRLDLRAGLNRTQFTDISSLLEPDSVILRDPTGRRVLRVLEQNFRADPITQGAMLSLNEGKTIDFLVRRADGQTEIVPGKIIRSGYLPLMRRSNGNDYFYEQSQSQPLIEVDGKLRFELPGTPLFPTLIDGTILKPTLHWTLETDKAGPLDAEIAYVTGGMGWSCDYNVVAPETGDALDITGWVTMSNNSGRGFSNARIKLMAGNVAKVQPQGGGGGGGGGAVYGARGPAGPNVTEKTFDEYHLYTLARPTTLLNRETKQVEFVRAGNIKSTRFYIYDGFRPDERYQSYGETYSRDQRDYGTASNTKVWTVREFLNTTQNGLGIPLPKGRLRFYRRDVGGALEFTGENVIDHTPRDETVRVYTGDAFDIVGERGQTNFKVDSSNYADESFEIKLRNRKREAVEVRVVEHLYRWSNWEITAQSLPFTKKDSRTVEFRVPLAPGEEKSLTYSVRYTWGTPPKPAPAPTTGTATGTVPKRPQ
jgi:hypothetical protein